MPYQIRSEKRPTNFDLDGTVWVVEDGQGSGLEIWPALGFNCYRWFVREQAGTRELLYNDPVMFEKNQTTRIGFPVLFPFPNRIRAGQFTWDGKKYQLPCNDPAHKNAIHGFACRAPWRVVDQGTSDAEAWVTGEFHASRDFTNVNDFPALASCWPADHRIRLTYRLAKDRLRLEAHVDNPDVKDLPFGLGFHPYFCADAQCSIQVSARECWELQENLPTGKTLPADGRLDLAAQGIGDLVFDDVLTGLLPKGRQDMIELGGLFWRQSGRALTIRCSADFRELVVFTPPHRQAVCLEPYTCTTDAVNLQARHVDAGWKVLPPGASWTGVVELAHSMP